jgi:hypothetical protein
MILDLKKLCLAGAAFSLAFSAGPVAANSVNFQGSTFTNKGLVGVARVPSNARDKYGETLGGWGSAMAIVPGSWKQKKDGSYTGNLVAVPDRGWNTQGTLDFRGRTQHFKATLTPFYGASTPAQDQLQLDYKSLTALHYVRPTTGLDAVKIIPGFGDVPDMPAGEDGHLAVDNEGIVFSGDGSFWLSDEYGPYVYHYAAGGKLLNALRPPEAFIPRRLNSHNNPVENFSANSPPIGQTYNLGNPVSGRQNNQGFEGLAISPDGTVLSVLLQSALIQDLNVADIKHTRRNTRLLQYNISDPMHPQLIHEYAVVLPTFQDQTTTKTSLLIAAQSELHALNDHQFMVLARDSSVGETYPATPGSVYRKVELIDTTGATDLAAPSVYAAYNGPTGQIAPNGALLPAITPVAFQEFLDINDNSQLNRFGLHNGAPANSNDLYEKWESLDIEPVNDPAAPNDYFLIIGSDNDFVTQDGFMVQKDGSKTPLPYSDASTFSADTLVLVYRVTLPTYVAPVPPSTIPK